MVKYTLLRFAIFFICLLVFYVLGLRSQTQLPYAVIGAALVSMVISYFALASMREEFSAKVARTVDDRVAARRAEREGQRGTTDEAAEDAEVDDTFR
ncbi:MAG: DUF4229 domain-containing protein [Actinomycetia bacterium]|nr:DUF4229 domain-containing protein [Actinomycetes bacterium]